MIHRQALKAAPCQLSLPLRDLLHQKNVNKSNKGRTLESKLCCPTHPFTETVEILKLKFRVKENTLQYHLFNPVLCLVDLELTLPLLLPGSVDLSTSRRGTRWRLRNFRKIKILSLFWVVVFTLGNNIVPPLTASESCSN